MLSPYNVVVVINFIRILLHKVQVSEREGKHYGEIGGGGMTLTLVRTCSPGNHMYM